jgi:peptidoglycan/LPS O-acetylase OafA/YrhL
MTDAIKNPGGLAEFNFITFLRGPAALLVLYSHFVGRYLEDINQTYWLKQWVDRIFVEPLVIVEDFGQLGVMVFFILSGFIITHVAQREMIGRFLLRRGFRIYPAYLVVVVLALLLDPAIRARLSEFSAMDYVRVATITNYMHDPQRVVLGVAWTLQIEVMFYVLVACLLAPIKRNAMLTVLIGLALIAALLATSRRFGSDWFLLAANSAYLPYLLIGQIVYFHRFGHLSGVQALLLGFAAYLLAVWGVWSIHTGFLAPSHSRTLCLVFALGIVFWAMRYAESFGSNKVSTFFSDISYSLYLVHGPLGLLVLAYLHPRIGFGNAAAIAVVASVASAYLMYRLVERPAIAMGRRMTSGKRSGTAAVPQATQGESP